MKIGLIELFKKQWNHNRQSYNQVYKCFPVLKHDKIYSQRSSSHVRVKSSNSSDEALFLGLFVFFTLWRDFICTFLEALRLTLIGLFFLFEDLVICNQPR